MTGTAVRAGGPFGKDGTIVEVPEIADLKGKCPFTGVVEKKQTGGEVLEMYLVADDGHLVVAQKNIPVLPGMLAIGTNGKMIHGWFAGAAIMPVGVEHV